MNEKTRSLFNRPHLLYVIVSCYVVAPIIVVGLFLHFGHVPLHTVLDRLYQACGPVAATWLLTAPLVGAAFFFTTRITWWVFVGHSSLIFVDTVLRWLARPLYHMQILGTSYQIMILVGDLALGAALVLACRPDFQAPYFQRERRGWRRSQRISMRHSVTINGHERRIANLSADGCFVADPGAVLDVGQVVTVEFQSRRLRLVCEGQIIEKPSGGYGIEFVALPNTIRYDISRAIKVRSTPRQECRVPCTIKFDGKESFGVLRDLSAGGCFIQILESDVAQGISGSVAVAGVRAPLPLRVVWSGVGGMAEKPSGIGARFMRADAAALRQLQAAAVAS